MGLLERLAAIIDAKANEVLDHYERPAELLDYEYERQIEQLSSVRQALADVAAARQQLLFEARRLEDEAAGLVRGAFTRIRADREDDARELLARGSVLKEGAVALHEQGDLLADEERNFDEAVQRLEDNVAMFGAERATLSVLSNRASASQEVARIRQDRLSAAQAVQRAENRAAEIHGRLLEVDHLLNSGTLHDPSRTPAAIATELEVARGRPELRAELTKVKAAARRARRD